MVKLIGASLVVITTRLMLLSCSFAPEEAMMGGRPAEYPDMRFENTRYILGLDGMEPFHIEAALIEHYDAAKRAYITDATFSQQSDENELLFSGAFGSAEVDTETHNISMNNGVFIRNYSDDFTIETEELTWDNEHKEASSGLDVMVTITMKEHDILRGTGFRGDFSSATFEFDHVEEGSIQYD